MTSPAQVEVVEEHVRDAVEKGARVVTGRKRCDGAATSSSRRSSSTSITR